LFAGCATDKEPDDGYGKELLCRGVEGDGDRLSGVRWRPQLMSNTYLSSQTHSTF
jgi:hypothetical protein